MATTLQVPPVGIGRLDLPPEIQPESLSDSDKARIVAGRFCKMPGNNRSSWKFDQPASGVWPAKGNKILLVGFSETFLGRSQGHGVAAIDWTANNASRMLGYGWNPQGVKGTRWAGLPFQVTGSGLSDLSVRPGFSGGLTSTITGRFRVRIDGTGTPDTFEWSYNGGGSWVATDIPITGAWQPLTASNVIYGWIKFDATTGHTAANAWEWQVGGRPMRVGEMNLVHQHHYPSFAVGSDGRMVIAHGYDVCKVDDGSEIYEPMPAPHFPPTVIGSEGTDTDLGETDEAWTTGGSGRTVTNGVTRNPWSASGADYVRIAIAKATPAALLAGADLAYRNVSATINADTRHIRGWIYIDMDKGRLPRNAVNVVVATGTALSGTLHRFPIPQHLYAKNWNRFDVIFTAGEAVSMASIGLELNMALSLEHFGSNETISILLDEITGDNATGDPSELFPDDGEWFFEFTWFNSERGEQSAPSPIAGPIRVGASGIKLDLAAVRLEGPPDSKIDQDVPNSPPAGADRIHLYAHYVPWGVDERRNAGFQFRRITQESGLPIPTAGSNGELFIEITDENRHDFIVSEFNPLDPWFDRPMVPGDVMVNDGDTLVSLGRPAYGVGRMTRVQGSHVISWTSGAATDEPAIGRWMEGRRLKFADSHREYFVWKAIDRDDDGVLDSLWIAEKSSFDAVLGRFLGAVQEPDSVIVTMGTNNGGVSVRSRFAFADAVPQVWTVARGASNWTVTGSVSGSAGTADDNDLFEGAQISFFIDGTGQNGDSFTVAVVGVEYQILAEDQKIHWSNVMTSAGVNSHHSSPLSELQVGSRGDRLVGAVKVDELLFILGERDAYALRQERIAREDNIYTGLRYSDSAHVPGAGVMGKRWVAPTEDGNAYILSRDAALYALGSGGLTEHQASAVVKAFFRGSGLLTDTRNIRNGWMKWFKIDGEPHLYMAAVSSIAIPTQDFQAPRGAFDPGVMRQWQDGSQGPQRDDETGFIGGDTFIGSAQPRWPQTYTAWHQMSDWDDFYGPGNGVLEYLDDTGAKDHVPAGDTTAYPIESSSASDGLFMKDYDANNVAVPTPVNAEAFIGGYLIHPKVNVDNSPKDFEGGIREITGANDGATPKTITVLDADTAFGPDWDDEIKNGSGGQPALALIAPAGSCTFARVNWADPPRGGGDASLGSTYSRISDSELSIAPLDSLPAAATAGGLLALAPLHNFYTGWLVMVLDGDLRGAFAPVLGYNGATRRLYLGKHTNVTDENPQQGLINNGNALFSRDGSFLGGSTGFAMDTVILIPPAGVSIRNGDGDEETVPDWQFAQEDFQGDTLGATLCRQDGSMITTDRIDRDFWFGLLVNLNSGTVHPCSHSPWSTPGNGDTIACPPPGLAAHDLYFGDKWGYISRVFHERIRTWGCPSNRFIWNAADGAERTVEVTGYYVGEKLIHLPVDMDGNGLLDGLIICKVKSDGFSEYQMIDANTTTEISIKGFWERAVETTDVIIIGPLHWMIGFPAIRSRDPHTPVSFAFRYQDTSDNADGQAVPEPPANVRIALSADSQEKGSLARTLSEVTATERSIADLRSEHSIHVAPVSARASVARMTVREGQTGTLYIDGITEEVAGNG